MTRNVRLHAAGEADRRGNAGKKNRTTRKQRGLKSREETPIRATARMPHRKNYVAMPDMSTLLTDSADCQIHKFVIDRLPARMGE